MHLRPGLGLASKLCGTAALGLLMGISGTLSLITIPALLSLPSASSASSTFHSITRHVATLRGLAALSAASFITAYSASPRGLRHPYLLYTTLLVTVSGFYDLALTKKAVKDELKLAERKLKQKQKEVKGKGKARMDASYEDLGDTPSEEEVDDSILEEEINGEQLRGEMVGFAKTERIRGAVSAFGFLLACVGLWGDGAH